MLEQIRQKLSELNCQAFVSTNRISRRYLTKFTGSAGLVWIDQTNQILITDFRYTEQATEQAVGWQVLEDNNFLDRVAALIKEHNITRLAFESEFITVAEYQTWQSKLGVDLVSTENFILDFRMVKTPEEIQFISQAAKIADQAFAKLLPLIKPGVQEIEIALELEYR